jgi:hypothetical protein
MLLVRLYKRELRVMLPSPGMDQAVEEIPAMLCVPHATVDEAVVWRRMVAKAIEAAILMRQGGRFVFV